MTALLELARVLPAAGLAVGPPSAPDVQQLLRGTLRRRSRRVKAAPTLRVLTLAAVVGLWSCASLPAPEHPGVVPEPSWGRSTPSPDAEPRHPKLLPTPENLRTIAGRIDDTSRSDAEDRDCSDLRSAAKWLYFYFREPALLKEWRELASSSNGALSFLAEQMVIELTGGDRLAWAERVFEEDASGCHRCWAGQILFRERRGTSEGASPSLAHRRRIEEALLDSWRRDGRKLRRSSVSGIRIWDNWASVNVSFTGGRSYYLLHREGTRWELLCRHISVVS